LLKCVAQAFLAQKAFRIIYNGEQPPWIDVGSGVFDGIAYTTFQGPTQGGI